MNNQPSFDQHTIESLPSLPLSKKKPHRHRKKALIIVALLLCVSLFALAFLWFADQTDTTATNENSQTKTSAQHDDRTLRIVATGDMIPHDSINSAAKQSDGSYDYLQFMQNMKPYFDEADVRFCNQATLAGGSQYGISGYPVFNAPTDFTRDLAAAGCNVINTGSNHSNDKNQEVLEASVAEWDKYPDVYAVAGANRSQDESNKIRYFEVEGVKFAFVSYTTYLNSPNKKPYSVTLYSNELAKKQITEARKNADIVMVSMRWGTEYSTSINASQETQSQYLADQGADIILGHGPHVLEPVKKLKGKNGQQTYVWYSLGNFLNAQLEIESLISGFAVMDVDKESKKIASIGYLPVYMHYEWSDADKAAENLMARSNFAMYLLEESAEPLQQSQNNTTAQEQTALVKELLNTYTKVPILTKQQYLSN